MYHDIMLTCYAGRFQDVVDMDKAIPGSTKPSSPKPDAAFVANQLVVRAAAKFNAEDESGDRWGALADLKQADKLQPNDLPTLQLRALVRLKLGDARGFLDDLHGRADTAQWLERKAYVSCSTGDDEQAVEDLVAADHISPGAADKVCDGLKNMLVAKGAPQSRMAELTVLRHIIHTRSKVSFCRPSVYQNHFLLFLLCAARYSMNLGCRHVDMYMPVALVHHSMVQLS